MEEYSYFRAEGLSLAAIQEVEDAQAEYREYRDTLCNRFNAGGAFIYVQNGAVVLGPFTFNRREDMPLEWEHVPSQGGVFAMPKAGSKDDIHLSSVAGLMERCCKKSTLESVLGYGQMPMREFPGGDICKSFVKDRMLLTPETRRGMQEEKGLFLGGCSAGRLSDPLKYHNFAGQWYIRVPNDPNGRPAITPPDAVRIAFGEMLVLDSQQNNISTQQRPKAPRP